MGVECCGGIVPFRGKDWACWVFLGEERKATELKYFVFAPTFEEDGAVLGEDGDCSLVKQDFKAMVAKFANTN